MGFQIPCLLGDTKNTEGVPKSLGDLTRGCQILGGAGSPMTPETPSVTLALFGKKASQERLASRVSALLNVE